MSRRVSEAPSDRPSFAVVSRFTVANGIAGAVKQAFLDRPHLVDSAPGFVRMDVLSPLEQPEEIWLLTYWTDEASFLAWHRGHAYHESHKGIPRGLKLVPRSAEIRHFAYVAS